MIAMSASIGTVVTASSDLALTLMQTSATDVPATTEVATSVVTITPIIVTSVITREGPSSGAAATIEIVAITIDAQPSECSSRWALAFSAGSTIITSGNYPEQCSTTLLLRDIGELAIPMHQQALIYPSTVQRCAPDSDR
jgi:hypothetical protein